MCRLGNNSIGDEGAIALGVALKESSVSKLQVLDLSGNQISVDSAEAIAAFSTTRKVRTSSPEPNFTTPTTAPVYIALQLNLSKNRLCNLFYDDDFVLRGTFDARGINAITDALRVGSITFLSLSENRLGDEGATLLVRALRSPEIKLLSLDLSKNNIGAVGAKELAGYLAVTSLTDVDLSLNNLADGRREVNTIEVQGSNLNEGANVMYQGREFVIDDNEMYEHTLTIEPVEPDLSGIKAIAEALHASSSITQVPAHCQVTAFLSELTCTYITTTLFCAFCSWI